MPLAIAAGDCDERVVESGAGTPLNVMASSVVAATVVD